MARIRTIKPEFWSSPSIGEAEPWARLLYVAMWNWADDYGVGTCEPRELMGFAFPHDEWMTVADFRRFLGEVRRVFGVEFFTVGGRRYYSIPSWGKHQKIDKRSTRRNPTLDDGTPWDPAPGSGTDQERRPDSTGTRRNPPSPRRGSGAGTEEQGNRGEELKPSCPPASPPDDSDPPALIEPPSKPPEPGSDDDPDWSSFWSAYPRKDAKKGARKAWRSAIKSARPVDIITGARRYANDPNRAAPFTAMAATWLNAGRWDDEPLPARTSASGYRPYQDPDPADYHGDL